MSPPQLRRGSRGEHVVYLQERLVARGYQLEVDGRFGLLTEGTVRTWQQFMRLAPDGIVGPATWTPLEQAYTVDSNAILTDAMHRWAADLAAEHVAPVHILIGVRTHEQQARIIYGRIKADNPDLDNYPKAYLAAMRAAYPDLNAMLMVSIADGSPRGTHLAREAVDTRNKGLLPAQYAGLTAAMRARGQALLQETMPEHLHCAHLERWAGWSS